MATATIAARPTKASATNKTRAKKKSNKDIIPQNKYMEAFLKHQGSFIVYDPKFML